MFSIVNLKIKSSFFLIKLTYNIMWINGSEHVCSLDKEYHYKFQVNTTLEVDFHQKINKFAPKKLFFIYTTFHDCELNVQ